MRPRRVPALRLLAYFLLDHLGYCSLSSHGSAGLDVVCEIRRSAIGVAAHDGLRRVLDRIVCVPFALEGRRLVRGAVVGHEALDPLTSELIPEDTAVGGSSREKSGRSRDGGERELHRVWLAVFDRCRGGYCLAQD